MFRGNRFLLLKRRQSPYHWCPPCGGVRTREAMVDALKREIWEETGLSVAVDDVVDAWQGRHDGDEVVSVTYLCEATTQDVVLSSEHAEYL